MESCRLILSYLAGPPTQSFELSGKIEAYQELSPDALSRLSQTQLDALAALNGTVASDDR